MPNEKPSDQLVDAKAILEAIMEVKCGGNDVVVKRLEETERALTSFILEEESLIHQLLMKTGAKPKLVRQLMAQIEGLALVCVLAIQKGHFRVWEQDPENSAIPDGPSTSAWQRT